jgi:ArsR family transcriptional regulator
MDPENILDGTASLFLALGDKTRLRLLNLMRDREICVSSFTGVLGQSQPLISRHLAYLRNSGIVQARRDGKWVHYSISGEMDENTGRLLLELFNWMENQAGLRADRTKYNEVCGEPAAAPVRIAEPVRVSRPRERSVRPKAPREIGSAEYVETVYDEPVGHNELEDFLL